MSESLPNSIKPIFLFSLPRSGSTLFMRIMGMHNDISTVYEPFILLPFLYALKNEGVYSEYNHEHTAVAIQDFCKNLPGGKEDYYKDVKRLVLNLYSKASKNGSVYFLDKTPNYFWIVDGIIKIFSDAKFIFLWRNPLSIVSSILKSWYDGYWNLYQHDAYLYEGVNKLISAYEKYANVSISIRYKDIVSDPISEWNRVFSYLGIKFDVEQLKNFTDFKSNARLAGEAEWHMYKEISQAPLSKWEKLLSNPIRKAWCRRYLRWIGEDRLAIMGYKLDELLHDLDHCSTSLSYFYSDIWRMPYGVLYRFFNAQIIKHNIQDLKSNKRIHIYK